MNKFIEIIALIDGKLMGALDNILLVLWNQFAVQRVHITRVLAVLMTSLFVLAAIFNLVSDSPLWSKILTTIMFTVCLLFTGLVHLMHEYVNKMPKRQQNFRALSARTNIGPIVYRVVFVAIMLLLNLGTSWLAVAIGMTQVLFFVIDDAFVSEEPRKPWKLKLPKFEFKFNQPLPQGV